MSGLVNGVRLPGDLLVQGRNQTIFGPNEFSGGMRVQGNVTLENVNGVVVREMYSKAILKSQVRYIRILDGQQHHNPSSFIFYHTFFHKKLKGHG